MRQAVPVLRELQAVRVRQELHSEQVPAAGVLQVPGPEEQAEALRTLSYQRCPGSPPLQEGAGGRLVTSMPNSLP